MCQFLGLHNYSDMARFFLWILAAIPVYRNLTGLPVLNRGLLFYLVLDFWLAWSTGKESIPHRSHRALLITLSLDTVEEVMVGEVDELEEDVGWSISCQESVMVVEGVKVGGRTCWQAWNHDRNEVLCVAVHPNTVFNDVVFDRWSTRMSIRVHRKAFRAMRLLACSRGLS